mmetsp:Transcript_20107/g.24779  ORF Transcript_20107/g.24779 Transcript_20107/m.24779 type:complete len:87 (+) Transcript_20107:520-780(+)|eukprot:CAMPEP_0170466060 /NCGR_PEP_ID=MMETSP0123-20130129/10172_1 /TAXON_ID=182087 /ORGANISM="Favella ehrenbergii, Strain Fehren 1" /LENGTH=86 /DNA_ID=CAMNT_0010732115 /DNA_START=520 /DNA_END=780 /DNA_ORIENTATION=+
MNFAYMFSFGEWRLGTDAIRYFDNSYYVDTRLYPSLLYIFGLMEHEDQVDYRKFESDETADQDIAVEDLTNENEDEEFSEDDFAAL